MGQEQSTLDKKGYKIEKETQNHVIATKDGDRFFIRKIKVSVGLSFVYFKLNMNKPRFTHSLKHQYKT